MVSGANGFELPHNNTSWVFNTWDFLWDGHSILPIYKKKQIARSHTKPLFDRASGLRLVVTIKAPGGVFLQGLTGRLWGCPLPCLASLHARISLHTAPTGCSFAAHCCSPSGAWEQDTTVYISISNFFCTSQQSVGPSKKCNSSLQGGNTKTAKCCLLKRTLDDCSTGFSGKKHKLSLFVCVYFSFI